MKLYDAFPNLRKSPFKRTGPATRKYNCIAWAAGDKKRWWWPTIDHHYWPPGVPRNHDLKAFIAAYATLGYARCDHGESEADFEKIAIYLDAEGTPTHVARGLPCGDWTSKLGENIDITHTLRGLEGPEYGRAKAFLKRPSTGAC